MYCSLCSRLLALVAEPTLLAAVAATTRFVRHSFRVRNHAMNYRMKKMSHRHRHSKCVSSLQKHSQSPARHLLAAQLTARPLTTTDRLLRPKCASTTSECRARSVFVPKPARRALVCECERIVAAIDSDCVACVDREAYGLAATISTRICVVRHVLWRSWHDRCRDARTIPLAHVQHWLHAFSLLSFAQCLFFCVQRTSSSNFVFELSDVRLGRLFQ